MVFWVLLGTVVLVFGSAYYFKNYNLATGKHKSLHVGFGFITRYDPDEGTQVVIVSRLLESPAGKADFQRGDILISKRGVDFTEVVSPDDFRSRMNRSKALSLHVGDEVEFVLERDGIRRSVTLKAEWVKKDFYVPPTKAKMDELRRLQETGLVGSSGFAWDIETGYFLTQARVSDDAVDLVIHAGRHT